jgi:hypothetical protein
VRRPPRPFSLTVQAYLAHLRDAGFTGAPPPETAGHDVLVAVAQLIRAPPARRSALGS